MKIVLFLPNWIGDVVMATPTIRAVRETYLQAEILGVCKPYVAQVVEGSPWFDRLIFQNPKGPREQRLFPVISRIKQEHPDIAILFPNSFRSAFVAWWSGCKKRIGFDRYWRGWMLTDRLHHVRDSRGKFKPTPIIDDYSRLLEPLGIPKPSYRMELFTTAKDELAADRVWFQLGLDRASEVIGLNPGAAFGAAKHWPIEYFAQLAQQLIDRRDASILVMCGPNEKETARQIVSQTNRANIHTLADFDVSLGLSKACVKRLNLLVTTDSGPRHFAAAFDVPVVSLFGPTFIDWTVTYFEKEIPLQEKVPCGPCQLRTCPLDHRCMTELFPQTVYFRSIELLNRFSTPWSPRHAS